VLRTNVPLTFGGSAPLDAVVKTNATANSPSSAAEARMVVL
jgi:hypothetical protein